MHLERRWKIWILVGVVIIGIVGIFFVPRIPQDQAYHGFADTRRILGIPNFWNVVTNLPFLLVGLFGFAAFPRNAWIAGVPGLRLASKIFLAGTILVGLGSAYYHYAPSNISLVWDRLPMTISFIAFFVIVMGDSISPTCVEKLIWPLVLLGVGSVGYWYATELRGAGDLRPYALVQFLPAALLPLILVLFGTNHLRVGFLWGTLVMYALAKVVEHFDKAIYDATAVISGHSIKHLLAAMAAFSVVLAFRPTGR